jgi:thiol:disulfide interchange protein
MPLRSVAAVAVLFLASCGATTSQQIPASAPNGERQGTSSRDRTQQAANPPALTPTVAPRSKEEAARAAAAAEAMAERLAAERSAPASERPSLPWTDTRDRDDPVDVVRKTLAAAEAAGQPVVVYFDADWARDAARFAQQVWGDDAVRAESERFTLLKVDLTAADQAPALQPLDAEFGTNGWLPALAFVDSQGRHDPAQNVLGATAANEVLARMKQVK